MKCPFSSVSAALPWGCALSTWDGGEAGRQGQEMFHLSLCNEKRNPLHGPGLLPGVLPQILLHCSQTHRTALHVCWLIATLVGELSNTKPNALQLQTAAANFWSRNTNHFFTWSLVGWAGHAAGATWLTHPNDLRNLTFSPASQETSHPGIPIAASSQADGLPIQQGIKWEALHQKKDAESYLWGTFHQFTPDEVLMPDFGWVSPFFLWVCWALSYGT